MTTPRRTARPPGVADAARAVLAHVEAYYAARTGESATEPTPGAVPLPARRYVAGGAPREVAWDSDDGQVTVALERVILGNPQAAPQPTQTGRSGIGGGGVLMRTAVLEVQVVRAAPGVDPDSQEPPSQAALDAHGEMLLVDAAMLTGALTDATLTAALATGGNAPEGFPRRVLLQDLVSLGPQGYLGAIAATLQVTVY